MSNQDRLHSSIESYIKLQIKKTKTLSSNDIYENMKKERPLLFKYFNPTIEQISYMILSNNKDILTPDMKRKTRSSKNTTPCDKYPSNLESLESILKKRDNKSSSKK